MNKNNATDRQIDNSSRRQITLLRTSTVCTRRGRSRSSHYLDIRDGLFVKPVRIGLRSTGTPDFEVNLLISATVAGKSEDEIRQLVKDLETARKTLV